MKNLLLIIVTLVFSLNSFSQEKNKSQVILENNTLKYIGETGGKITSFQVTMEFDGFGKSYDVKGDRLTEELITVIDNLSKYYNEGDTTEVVFKKIIMTSDKNKRIPLHSLIKEIIF